MTAVSDVTSVAEWLAANSSASFAYASLIATDSLTAVPAYQHPGHASPRLPSAPVASGRANQYLWLFVAPAGLDGIPSGDFGTPDTPEDFIPKRVPFPEPTIDQRGNLAPEARAATLIGLVRAGRLPNVVIVALPTPTTTISAALASAGISNPGSARAVLAIPTYALDDGQRVNELLPVT